jgi:hypothetical protein
MREIVHIQAGQCGNQIGAKVSTLALILHEFSMFVCWISHFVVKPARSNALSILWRL